MNINNIISYLKQIKYSRESKNINIALGYYQLPKSLKQSYLQGLMKITFNGK